MSETASRLEDVLDAVHEDPHLTPEEKQTTFLLEKGADTLKAFTDEAGLLRRFVAHPESEINYLTVLDGDRRETIDGLAEYSGGRVVSGEVTLPVGVLQVKSSARKSHAHAEIVSERVFDAVGGEPDA